MRLREPSEDEAEEFVRLVASSRQLHGSWVHPPADTEAYRRYLERCKRKSFRGFLICRAADGDEDGAIAGVANLSQIVRGNFLSAYLDFYAFAPHARKGYMTQGVDLVLGHAFGELRLHRVEANIQPANASSKALVQRLGFRLEGLSPQYLKIEGRWRDHERWAILAEEWAERHQRQQGMDPDA